MTEQRPATKPRPPDPPETGNPTGDARANAALAALAAVTAEPSPLTAPASRRGSEKRQRARLVPVRCTEAEHAAIAATAAEAGMSAGAYLRALALGSPGPRAARRPPIEREALARILGHLGKLGSNVNQLAYVANTAGATLSSRQLDQIGDEVREIRSAVMKALGRGD